MRYDSVSGEAAFLRRMVFFGTAVPGRRTLAPINGRYRKGTDPRISGGT